MVFNLIGKLLHFLYSVLCQFFFPASFVKFHDVCVVHKGKLIGEGAFSYVYKARRFGDTASYALKRIALQSSTISSSAKAEILALRTFQHPNIIQLTESCFVVENSKTVAYLLFPFIECGNLRNMLDDRLRSNGDSTSFSWDLKSILRQFTSICSAIAVMHGHTPSMIHGDIKPDVRFVQCGLSEHIV